MHVRIPEWLKTHRSLGTHDTMHLLRRHKLLSVCEKARCPNRGECFSRPTAAFLILGTQCTRSCAFCSVDAGVPRPIDDSEPERIAAAASEMNLGYVVITSVTRDDLPDGGAGQFAKTVKTMRAAMPKARIEVLIPDFNGDTAALDIVLAAKPDVLNHNMETVARLYRRVRSKASYDRSLSLLANAKSISADTLTKSGLMLGLGETIGEVLELLADLRKSRCDLLTIGQYLQPTKKNLPVVEYIRPETFKTLGKRARDMGFRSVASGPLVRSSMHAQEMYNDCRSA